MKEVRRWFLTPTDWAFHNAVKGLVDAEEDWILPTERLLVNSRADSCIRSLCRYRKKSVYGLIMTDVGLLHIDTLIFEDRNALLDFYYIAEMSVTTMARREAHGRPRYKIATPQGPVELPSYSPSGIESGLSGDGDSMMAWLQEHFELPEYREPRD